MLGWCGFKGEEGGTVVEGRGMLGSLPKGKRRLGEHLVVLKGDGTHVEELKEDENLFK